MTMNDKLGTSQLMFSTMCFLLAAAMLNSFVAGITLQDTWITSLIALVLYLLFLPVLLALIRRFPSMDLYDINCAVFGKIPGKIISFIYLVFFYFLTTLNLKDSYTFIQATIMNRTPIEMLGFTFIILCGWAVYNGLSVVCRYTTAVVLISLFLNIFSIVTTYHVMNLDNYLPIFSYEPIKYVQSTHTILSIPYGELVVLLMIAPEVKRPGKGLGKPIVWGFILGALSHVLVIMRDVAVLGNTISLYALPSFETLRLSKITASISHLEILYAVVLILLLFYRVSFLFYCTLKLFCKIFSVKSHNRLVMPFGLLILLYALFVYKNNLQHYVSGNRVIPFLWLFPEMILPIVTLILAVVLKRKQKERMLCQ